MLCPCCCCIHARGQALPTSPPEITGDFIQAASYTFMANLIDIPAGVSPMCRLDCAADAADDDFWAGVHKAGDCVTLGPMRKAYEVRQPCNYLQLFMGEAAVMGHVYVEGVWCGGGG